MNIEEERKAFYAAVRKSGKRYYIDDAFEGWLMAKAHAAEMAKPTARIVYKLLKSAEPETFGETLYDSEFGKLTCQQWAKDNGYRVIE